MPEHPEVDAGRQKQNTQPTRGLANGNPIWSADAGLRHRALALGRFLGRPAVVVLSLGLVGSLLLAIAEFGVAMFIQIFLVALGLMNQPPTGLLSSLDVSLPVAGVILAAVAAVRSAGQFFVIFSSNKSMALMQQRLRMALGAAMLYSPEPPDTKETHSHLSETFPKSSNFANSATFTFSALIQMAALGVAMAVAAWREAAVAMVFLGVVGLIVLRLNKAVRREADALPGQQTAIVESIERIAANWLLVVVLKTRVQEFLRIKGAIDAQTDSASHAYRLGALASALAPFLGIIILLGVIFLSQGVFETSPSRLLVFLYLFVRFVQLMSGAAAMYGLVNANYAYFKLGFEYFIKNESHFRRALSGRESAERAPVGPAPKQGAAPTLAQPNHLKGLSKHSEAAAVSVTCRDLAFRYSGREDHPALFRGLSLDVAPGEHVGIMGPSGSGKSTLLFLMLGVLRPTEGWVKLNGEPASDAIQQRHLKVAYVGPDPFLFEGTVYDNLVYGLDTANQPTPDETLEVLRGLDLVPLAGQTEGFLSAAVAAGGANFSTGQRQRLCFARAVLSRPQLLVLDEVSANLDAGNDARLAEWLRDLKGRCTTLIVTHREGILAHADRVIDLPKVARLS
jgi:ABC-type multidrug transport system fused ATPase/permease subunit